MRTGPAWAGTIGDIPVRVEYTRHFVDRFEKDEGDRAAVARYMDEPEVLDVILDALPNITEKWKTIWDHSGVITSRGRDLNMSFVTDTDHDGLKVVMKNMMLKPVYHAQPQDYVFAVAGTSDPELGVAIAAHLASMAGARLSGRVEAPEATFNVGRLGRAIRVSGAKWRYDTHVYTVA